VDEDLLADGLLQIRNTPHKNSGLSPAILLFGRPLQDKIPAHKSAFKVDWFKEMKSYDRKMAESKIRMERYYNRGKVELPPLKVSDPVVIQNNRSGKWDRIGWIQEKYAYRRYLVRLPSGLFVERNRKFLRRRYSPDPVACTKVTNQETIL